MRLSMSRLFRSYRASRERTMLEAAMRAAPVPQPPAGLKERLIEQAIAASRERVGEPVRPLGRIVWAVGGCAVLVMAAWLSHSFVTQPAPTARPIIHPVHIARPIIPGQAQQSIAQRAVPRGRQTHVRLVYAPQRLGQYVRTARLVNWSSIKRHKLPHQQMIAKAPVIQVSVTHTSRPSIGYARVAAYSTDDSGRDVKTACTLIDDPRTGSSEQEVSVNDNTGRLQLLKVSIVAPLDHHKGDEL